MATEIDCLSRLAAKARTAPVPSTAALLHPSSSSSATEAAYLAGDAGGRRAALLFTAGEEEEEEEGGEGGAGALAMGLMDVDSTLYQTLQMCMECLMKVCADGSTNRCR
jgi:hypothetical protein